MNAIRLERPLPLLVSAGECIYEIHTDFEDETKQWHLAASRLGDGFAGWVTVGRPTNGELLQALACGIEIAPGFSAAVVAAALVDQGRAEFVKAA